MWDYQSLKLQILTDLLYDSSVFSSLSINYVIKEPTSFFYDHDESNSSMSPELTDITCCINKEIKCITKAIKSSRIFKYMF